MDYERLQNIFKSAAQKTDQIKNFAVHNSKALAIGFSTSLLAGLLLNSCDGQIELEAPEGDPCTIYQDIGKDLNRRVRNEGYSGTVNIELTGPDGDLHRCTIEHG